MAQTTDFAVEKPTGGGYRNTWGGTLNTGLDKLTELLALALPVGSIQMYPKATAPTATADWGIIGWVGIYDALTSGNLVAYQNLQKSDFSTSTTKTVNDGDIFKFNASTIKIQLD